MQTVHPRYNENCPKWLRLSHILFDNESGGMGATLKRARASDGLPVVELDDTRMDIKALEELLEVETHFVRRIIAEAGIKPIAKVKRGWTHALVYPVSDVVRARHSR